MLMGKTESSYSFETGLMLLLQHDYENAYTCFRSLRPERAESLFNLALCDYHVQRYQACKASLDKALALCPSGFSGAAVPSREAEFKHSTQQSPLHLQPMPEQFLTLFAQSGSHRILRISFKFLIAVNLKLEAYPEVRQIAARLQSFGYEDVADALNEAEGK